MKLKKDCSRLTRGGLRRKLFDSFSFVAAAIFLFLSQNLLADLPQRSMANLQIEDRGSQLVVSWHFFYILLPEQFILHEKNDTPMSLHAEDDQLLKRNLSDFVQVAFDFKINGQTVQPTLMSLTCYPNKSCLVVMSYPGHPRSKVDLEAPVLKYFPKGYFLSVSVSGSKGIKGFFFGRQFPSVIHFEQDDIARPPQKPFFSRDQVAQFGAAWVNYNWILTCIVLLMMRQLRLIAVLIVAMLVCWIILSFAVTLFNYKIPFKIAEMCLCVPTVLLCVVRVKDQYRLVLLVLLTIIAGALNAYYDVQQIPLSVPATTLNALTGLALGFAAGLTLVLFVLIPLWWECKKYPGFQEHWAPKISWLMAALAVFLPLQKWLF